MPGGEPKGWCDVVPLTKTLEQVARVTGEGICLGGWGGDEGEDPLFSVAKL